METRREYETYIIYNMIRLMDRFVDKKTWSLKSVMKENRKLFYNDVEDTLRRMLTYTSNHIAFEELVLTYELFTSQGMDFSDPNITKVLAKIKKGLPDDYKTLNGAEFLKLIRCSIAHNSEENRNVESDFSRYKIVLAKKGVAKLADHQFSSKELFSVLSAYDESQKNYKTFGRINTELEIDSVDKLLKERKKQGAFSNFLSIIDAKDNIVELDQFQEATLLRFMIKHKATMNKMDCFLYFFTRYFPFKDNKVNVYEHKYQLLVTLLYLRSRFDNKSSEDVVKDFKKGNPGAVLPYIDHDFMKSLLYSSLAFDMFSSRTNEESAEVIKKAELDIPEYKVRHIRNAFIHGRYFFNFKDGFELYDGQKELSHVLTLTFEQLEKIFNKYCEDEIAYIQKRRQERFIEDFIE